MSRLMDEVKANWRNQALHKRGYPLNPKRSLFNSKGSYPLNINHSSGDNYATPWLMWNPINAEFGFTIDVAADGHNHKVVPYWTKKHNALRHLWKGTCWCNPPYSRIDQWVRMCRLSADAGAVVVALLPQRQHEPWFSKNCLDCEIRLLKGRVKFKGAPGKPMFQATFGTMLVIFRKESQRIVMSDGSTRLNSREVTYPMSDPETPAERELRLNLKAKAKKAKATKRHAIADDLAGKNFRLKSENRRLRDDNSDLEDRLAEFITPKPPELPPPALLQTEAVRHWLASSEKVLFMAEDALLALRRIPDNSVDVAFGSPPYWFSPRRYNPNDMNELGREPTRAQYLARMGAIGRELKRVLKKAGSAFFVIGDMYSTGNKLMTSQHHDTSGLYARRSRGSKYNRNVEVKSTLREFKRGNRLNVPGMLAETLRGVGLIHRDELVWGKQNPRTESQRSRSTKAHEFIQHFVRRMGYYWDHSKNQEPATSKSHPSGTRKIRGVIRNDTTEADVHRDWGSEGVRTKRSFRVHVFRPNRTTHTAPFSPELVRDFILPACPPKAIVLDCFGGSGTTAIVAVLHGFRCIHIDPNFIEEAKARFMKETGLEVD